MSNLRLINETTASSVSTFQATDIFSTDYDIYKLEINNLDLATAGYLRAKFINSSGSVIASSSYDWAFLDMVTYASPYTQQRNTGDTNMAVAYGGNTATADAGGFIIYVFNPMNSSSYTFTLSQSSTMAASGLVASKGIAVLKQTSAIAGIELYVPSATMETMNLRTYGLRVDS